MKTANALALSSAIGALAGLRSFTPLAVVSQAARHNLLALRRSPLCWLHSSNAAALLTALAGGELVADKLPSTPSRTDSGPLLARIVSGAVCGAAIASTRSRRSLRSNAPGLRAAGALCGAAGAIAGAFAGYHVRRHLSLNMGVPDAAIAIVEDGVAIGGSMAIVKANASLISVATRGVL